MYMCVYMSKGRPLYPVMVVLHITLAVALRRSIGMRLSVRALIQLPVVENRSCLIVITDAPALHRGSDKSSRRRKAALACLSDRFTARTARACACNKLYYNVLRVHGKNCRVTEQNICSGQRRVTLALPSVLFQHTKSYKSSAVAEMGDRLATIDMGRKVGRLLCPFPSGSWVPM